MRKLKVLVVGNGAREHALVWKIKQSPKMAEVFCAPGNGGTDRIATNIPIAATDILNLIRVAREKKIDLVVVGPEAPLATGLVLALIEEGILAFGPTARATLIESSKIFSAWLMDKYDIPHALGKNFSNYDAAKSHLLANKDAIEKEGIVIKADGLASGKGVMVAENLPEALEGLDRIMLGQGDAGRRVRIEEKLVGREFSFMVFTDGKTIIPLPTACDYKRAKTGDKGPNTGGMGAYSPSEFIDNQLTKKAQDIMQKAVDAMLAESRRFMGLLYGGFIMTNEGPKVLEFNARFGDPETQVQLPLMETDLVDVILATIRGELEGVKIRWSQNACAGVVLASAGYPDNLQKGVPIFIDPYLDDNQLVLLFHGGTKIVNGELFTDGGRVITVVSRDKHMQVARDIAYAAVTLIRFKGKWCRTDIADRAVKN